MLTTHPYILWYKCILVSIVGKLSLKQMADYHHIAFKQFAIPTNFYGGTWLDIVPDQAEFALYGNLYCHDCDTASNYKNMQLSYPIHQSNIGIYQQIDEFISHKLNRWQCQ